MKQYLSTDPRKGGKLAELLTTCFSTTGILGNTEMPEDILPRGIVEGSLDHLLFITLTVSIDYQRDADTLWEVSRKTWEDRKTRYLFDPEALHKTKPRVIVDDMQKNRLSKKQSKDANIWRTIGVTFLKKWEGNPIKFLESCGWDALDILSRLKDDSHLYNDKAVPDYPYLRGNKIGPLWLRMLRDNVGIKNLTNLENVPIPVDIHIARSTLATGIVRGQFSGALTDLFELIRETWFESVEGLKAKDREMIALDVDEPLWHLSKYGCTKRNKENGLCPVGRVCEARSFCTKGKIWIEKNRVELDT